MLSANGIAARLGEESAAKRLVVAPCPDADSALKRGESSLDLRLGSWFSVLRSARIPSMDVAGAKQDGKPPSLTKMHFVKFGESFVLHPRSFVLGVTLEWIRLPLDIGAYVTSRSSWGRRGLIIATAVGVHPGFAGCLTLELSNVGEVPIHLYPGMQVCQIFFHLSELTSEESDETGASSASSDSIGRFVGKRRPLLGSITKLQDSVFVKLAQLHSHNKPEAFPPVSGPNTSQELSFWQ